MVTLVTHADGQTLFGADLNTDTAALKAEASDDLTTLLGGFSALVSGGALSAGPGLTINVAQASVITAGLHGTVAAGPVTIAAGGAQARTDVIYAHLTGTTGTDSAGNPTGSDAWALGVQQGTGGGGVPSLTDNTYCQIGTVSVPAGAATAGACTLNSQVTAPNSIGPIGGPVATLLSHIAASYAAGATVHGIAATTPGGTAANALAQTDASGRVGHAVTADTATSATTATTATTATNATQLGGVAASGFDAAGSAAAVQTNLSGHTAINVQTGTAHNLWLQRGVITGISLTSGMGRVVNTYSFPTPFDIQPAVVTATATIDTADGSSEDIHVKAQPISASQFKLMMNTGGNFNGNIQWIAVR